MNDSTSYGVGRPGPAHSPPSKRGSPPVIRILPTMPSIVTPLEACADLGAASSFGELPPEEPGLEPALDPLDRFIARKLTVTEAGIRQVAKEIEARIRLRDRQLQAIDEDIAHLKERLYQAAPWGHASPFGVGDAKRRGNIESQLAALEVEKRREESSAWRDVAGLKRELRELVREYEEEKRKQEVVLG